MNRYTIPSNLLGETTMFKITREGQVIGIVRGYFCYNDPTPGEKLQLLDNVDVKVGDVLMDAETQKRYFAVHVHPVVMDGVITDWIVRYMACP